MRLFRVQKALDRLEDRLKRLEDTCADLVRDNRKLNLEFTELYDKVSRQMSRMAKRYAVDQKETTAPPPPPALDAEISPSAGLDPISEKILARRGIRRAQQ